MSDQNHDIDAALAAAGALDPAEWDAMRERLRHDPAFAREADAWEQDLAPLAGLLADVEPPEDLLARIEARLDAAAPRTLKAGHGEWVEIGPGIRIKVLHVNPDQRRQTVLLEADPGAVHPAHVHEGDEEVFVVSGDLTIDGEELRAGDFHFSPAGSRHPQETTRDGCLCVITMGV